MTLPHPALTRVGSQTYRYRGRIIRRITVDGHNAWVVGGAQYRRLANAMAVIDDEAVQR